MKLTDAVFAVVIIIVILFFLTLFSGGCAIFQPSTPGDVLADLPTTGPEAMFQTLKKANWLFTLSIVGVGAGFFAFLNGSSKGLQFMAACFVVISLIIGVTRYSAVIAAISLIGTVCLMIYSVLVRRRAMREVVQGVESIRTMPLDGTTYNELAANVNGFLSDTQSKTTEAIVKAVKGRL